MIQAANELMLGIDLRKEHAQVTYYHQAVREPLTLHAVPGEEQPFLPMALRMDSSGVWHLWDQKEDAAEEGDRCRITGIYERIERQEETDAAGEQLSPAKLLELYFGQCRDLLRFVTSQTRIHVMVTVRNLTEQWSRVITEALEGIGIERKYIYVQDYLSSFYYYTVNQKKELWYQDVALLEYENETMIGYILHIDRSTRPALASVKEIARQSVSDEVRAGRTDSDWNKEKDRLFFELLKKVFERRTVSVSYLMSDFYSRDWAERSIQFLCYKRHAYQGQNLYSRGACYAAMERAGLIADRGILFGGGDMVTVNLGMEMRIRGKETYYPLVTAGVNWYEAHHVCEFIPAGEREIRIISTPMASGYPVTHMLHLTSLPERPDRTLRLRMTLYFTSVSQCHVEVEDLGFGGLYKSSGMKWERDIYVDGKRV
ncbi:MAG: DUF5716 family protein [Lachnospiraceae bacterium]|nr:DUF5716 family protein [Lachnospiraceae bacterium]